MSAVAQLPSYLEQPHASKKPDRPDNIGFREQPARKQPQSAHSVKAQLIWQIFNEQPPAGSGLRGLDERFVVDNRLQVARLIEANRLRGLLAEAANPLDDAFGDVIKTLRVVNDDEGVETLFCFVLTSETLVSATRALEMFDNSWWLAHCGQVAGKLNFDFQLI